MFRKLFLSQCQRAIKKQKPEISISLNREIPTPSLQEITKLVHIVAQVNSYEEELKTKSDDFFKEKTQEYKRLIAERTVSVHEDEFKDIAE